MIRTTRPLAVLAMLAAAACAAPLTVESPTATTAEDTPVTLTFAASRTSGVTFAITTPPAHGTATIDGITATYAPAADFNGADSFAFSATAGSEVVTGTIAITVTAVNDAPAATSGTATGAEDTELTIELAATDVDGDDVTFAVARSPEHGTVTIDGHTARYTPEADWSGLDGFAFTATDGTLESASADVDVTVTAVNDAPVADATSGSTDEDAAVTITLTGTDVESDPLSFVVTTQPAHGQVTITGGSATYTPAADFNGTDAFAFAASDGSAESAPATVTLTIRPMPDAPVAHDQALTTRRGEAITFALDVTDADGDAVTGELRTWTKSGRLAPAGTSWTYTPPPGFIGVDRFRFVAKGSTETSLPATVTITVAGVPDTARLRVTAPVAFNRNTNTDNDCPTSVTPDGRYVVFCGSGANIFPGERPYRWRVYRRDLWTGQIVLVSRGIDGADPSSDSWAPNGISDDGNVVVFTSDASNLVPDDTNGNSDVFVYEVAQDRMRRVSVGHDGSESDGYSYGVAISGDGRWVVFHSRATNLVASPTISGQQVYAFDRTTGVTQLVSQSATGVAGDSDSQFPVVSGDGAWIAFQSRATNLVAGDTNGKEDVFLVERATGAVQRLSVAAGVEADGGSGSPGISADGRHVAFITSATNLPGTDTEDYDYLSFDRVTGELTYVAAEANDQYWEGFRPALSADGRYVMFKSGATGLVEGDTNERHDVFRWDRQTGAYVLLNVDDEGRQVRGGGGYMSLSGDGTYAVFVSGVLGDTLVPFDANEAEDVFVRDVVRGTTLRVSEAPNRPDADLLGEDVGAFSLATDGSHIVFETLASGLVAHDPLETNDVFVFDATTGVTDRTARARAPAREEQQDVRDGRLSGDGKSLAFVTRLEALQGGVNEEHVFVRTRTGEIVRVSAAEGVPAGRLFGAPSLDATGRFVAFATSAALAGSDTNGAGDVYVRDLETGTLTRASLSDTGAAMPQDAGDAALDGAGSLVAFVSPGAFTADADTNGATDVYVRNLATSTTTLVSRTATGTTGDGASLQPLVSRDGRKVVFLSQATNLTAAADANGATDVFAWDAQSGQVQLVSVASGGGAANGASASVSVSDDGRFVAFVSDATNLVAGDTNGKTDAFVRDLVGGATTRLAEDVTGVALSGDGRFAVVRAADDRDLFRIAGPAAP